MQVIRYSLSPGGVSLQNLNLSSCVATVGTFDGVHLGHRFLISQVMGEARSRQLQSMVVTFERPPSSFFGNAKPCLTSLDDKLRLLGQTGVDLAVVLQFDQAMASLSARRFMELLRKEFHVVCMVIGFNNRFGCRSGRPENFSDYLRYGRQLGIDVKEAPPYDTASTGLPAGQTHQPADQPSSSLIRDYLLSGRIAEANRLLGYPYTLRGMIVHGCHVGTQLGFPTANLTTDVHCLVPMPGVYAVRCQLSGPSVRQKAQQGQMGGMMNIGTRPTFGRHAQTLEVHLFQPVGDLYGQQLSVSFVGRLRSEQAFPSPEALALQLAQDKEECQRILIINSTFSVM